MPETEIDVIAQAIRMADGNHNLGAGALAEALLPTVRALMAQAWDEALTHAWALNDPAYTTLTDTESIYPLLTHNDIEQARRENPHRVLPPAEERR